jgi:hypothetical protein
LAVGFGYWPGDGFWYLATSSWLLILVGGNCLSKVGYLLSKKATGF